MVSQNSDKIKNAFFIEWEKICYSVIYADLESSIKRIDGCKNNFKK